MIVLIVQRMISAILYRLTHLYQLALDTLPNKYYELLMYVYIVGDITESAICRYRV